MMEKLEALTAQVAGMISPVDVSEAVFEPADAGYVSDEAEQIKLEIEELPIRTPQQRARVVAQRVQQQVASRQRTVGFHHGRFNPLPST